MILLVTFKMLQCNKYSIVIPKKLMFMTINSTLLEFTCTLLEVVKHFMSTFVILEISDYVRVALSRVDFVMCTVFIMKLGSVYSYNCSFIYHPFTYAIITLSYRM